mmetsp:Transcript_77238/g.133651  ORF Transcript_77238/g.133651 Transcript_77238/m.133651 type:complete len:108 (-) Transcript_77238:162-485(-)
MIDAVSINFCEQSATKTELGQLRLQDKSRLQFAQRQSAIRAELSQPTLPNCPEESASQQLSKKVLHLPTMMSIFSSVSSGNIGSERSCGALFDVLGSCPAYTSISFL